jgi:hypothetical protein
VVPLAKLEGAGGASKPGQGQKENERGPNHGSIPKEVSGRRESGTFSIFPARMPVEDVSRRVVFLILLLILLLILFLLLISILLLLQRVRTQSVTAVFSTIEIKGD